MASLLHDGAQAALKPRARGALEALARLARSARRYPRSRHIVVVAVVVEFKLSSSYSSSGPGSSAGGPSPSLAARIFSTSALSSSRLVPSPSRAPRVSAKSLEAGTEHLAEHVRHIGVAANVAASGVGGKRASRALSGTFRFVSRSILTSKVPSAWAAVIVPGSAVDATTSSPARTPRGRRRRRRTVSRRSRAWIQPGTFLCPGRGPHIPRRCGGPYRRARAGADFPHAFVDGPIRHLLLDEPWRPLPRVEPA